MAASTLCPICRAKGHAAGACPQAPLNLKRLPQLESARERRAAEEEVQAFDLRGFWRKVGRLARVLPFIRTAVVMFYCMLDPDTPLRVKAAVAGALAYFVLPLDLVPDFLPIIGYGDDGAVVLGTWSLIQSHVNARHHQLADRKLGLSPGPQLITTRSSATARVPATSQRR